MCNWHNISTIITTTIITIISGADIAGITITTIITITATTAIEDGRNAERKQDPIGVLLFADDCLNEILLLARLLFRGAMKVPVGAVEHRVG